MMRGRTRTITTFMLAALLFGALLRLGSSPSFAAETTQVNATARVAICGNGIKEGGEQCDGSDFGGFGCTDAGFDGGALACDASCDYGFAACTTAASQVDVVLLTASTGGQHTLTNADGSFLTVSVPAWFHARDALMLVSSYAPGTVSATMPPPDGLNLVGRAYGVTFIDQDGAAITTLLQPANLMIGYEPSDAAGLKEATFTPYRRPSGGTWQALSGASMDAGADTATFSTAAFSAFAVFGQRQGAADNGGGGGGGGQPGDVPPTEPATSVIFSGTAFPGGVVSALLDGLLIATAEADDAAAFMLDVPVPGPGAYAFSLYAHDAHGTRSATLSYPVVAAPGPNVFDDIFFPPTIEADALEVRQGQSVRIMGRSVPYGEISVTRGLGDGSVARTRTDEVGAFELRLDTSSVEAGEYVLRAKAEREERASPFGRSLKIVVRSRTIPFPISRSGSGAPARTADGASTATVVDLAALETRQAPAREVFVKEDEGSSDLKQVDSRPARRSILARVFSWLAGLFRSIIALARG